jgi:hypothetical protein
MSDQNIGNQGKSDDQMAPENSKPHAAAREAEIAQEAEIAARKVIQAKRTFDNKIAEFLQNCQDLLKARDLDDIYRIEVTKLLRLLPARRERQDLSLIELAETAVLAIKSAIDEEPQVSPLHNGSSDLGAASPPSLTLNQNDAEPEPSPDKDPKPWGGWRVIQKVPRGIWLLLPYQARMFLITTWNEEAIPGKLRTARKIRSNIDFILSDSQVVWLILGFFVPIAWLFIAYYFAFVKTPKITIVPTSPWRFSIFTDQEIDLRYVKVSGQFLPDNGSSDTGEIQSAPVSLIPEFFTYDGRRIENSDLLSKRYDSDFLNNVFDDEVSKATLTSGKSELVVDFLNESTSDSLNSYYQENFIGVIEQSVESVNEFALDEVNNQENLPQDNVSSEQTTFEQTTIQRLKRVVDDFEPQINQEENSIENVEALKNNLESVFGEELRKVRRELDIYDLNIAQKLTSIDFSERFPLIDAEQFYFDSQGEANADNCSANVNLFDNYQVDWKLLVVAVVGGAIGSSTSILLTVQSFRSGSKQSASSLFMTGCLRPITGMLLAVFLFALIEADFVPLSFDASVVTVDGQVRQNSPSQQRTYFYFTLAFIAGFSEQVVIDLIQRTERGVTGK